MLRQTIVLWSLDPGDVFQRDTRAFLDWLEGNPPVSGDIVLLHDRSTGVEALPQLIALVRSRNLEFATVSDWLKPRAARVPATRTEHV
jgi:peptidoglycan/xylan/chitin deacetylase (PgdA/CDA1 family)